MLEYSYDNLTVDKLLLFLAINNIFYNKHCVLNCWSIYPSTGSAVHTNVFTERRCLKNVGVFFLGGGLMVMAAVFMKL